MRPNQRWWEYWDHYQEDDVRSQIAYRRSGREWVSPERPGYGMGLRATVKHLCEYEVVKAKQLFAPLPYNVYAPPLTKLVFAEYHGWTPNLLVARSVLTLWALLAVSPMMLGIPDPTTENGRAFLVPMDPWFQTLSKKYVANVLTNPALRLPRPEC